MPEVQLADGCWRVLQMLQLEGTFDAACQVAAALPQEKRSAARHRGASATWRSSNIAVHHSSMAQQDTTQIMVSLHQPVLGCAMATLGSVILPLRYA